MPKPGWSDRQYEKAKQDVESWPAWLRANLNVRQAADQEMQASARINALHHGKKDKAKPVTTSK